MTTHQKAHWAATPQRAGDVPQGIVPDARSTSAATGNSRGFVSGHRTPAAADDALGVLRYVSQLFLSSEFIVDGANAFRTPGERVQQAAKLGMPNPELAVKANGVAMVIGGTALALNVAPRVAATLLACCLIPTTLAGHPFWKESSEAGRTRQRTQFLKNLSMLGGLLFVASRQRPRSASKLP
ncbi:MAG: DoxX family protein [Ktedonobacterales bacterium]